MQTTKKKPNLLLIAAGAFISAFLGYLVAGAWHEGIELNAFLERFTVVCSYPLHDYYNEYTFKMISMALVIYAIAIVMYYTSQRNYMPGKEYGTSKLASIKQVNRMLADKDNSKNRILSQNVRMSLDTRHTGLNNNVLIVGGSGAGKTFYEVKPNLMQLNSSFICTDPKGEILRSEGEMLKKNGYNVKVINLLEMDKSDCYNPFSYIREETDVVKLITNLMSNTTPKGSTPADPFWEKAESMFLQALFYYVWLEEKPAKRNFASVLKLIGEAEVMEKGKPSPLDVRMKFLEETSPLGSSHPAVKQYNKCMRGAGDTVRSIIISANSRLATLENKQVLHLLSRDELNLAELGIGVNGDGKTKTALFCVIPDSDKSYNYIIGMLYTQIFQELYYQADFNCGGRLPVHVTFMLDEFANVALPDDYCSLLSTMRSREISSVIIIQNLAQIKALFKDTWETIPGNCDTLVYLGGNEQSTHKYISELLGKATIDKKTSGETKGRQGSSSRNYDVLGREIMTPDEVRKLDNKKCLLFIRGFDPILDDKYRTFGHPMFSQTADGEGKPYVHISSENREYDVPAFVLLNQNALEYYEGLKQKGESVYIDTISYEDFMLLGQFEMEKRFMDMDEQEQRERLYAEEGSELAYAEDILEEMEEPEAAKAEMSEQEGRDYGAGEQKEDDCMGDSIPYRMPSSS
ncbi:MAG: type IV secretory system conjugative DNA transfer family protein [Lachnospiraceae bacterium]|nr:type IV secretory system conjugative DNA transfer family protein [Lachnospiraceae bacterium]